MEVIPTQKSFRSYMFFWSGQLFSLLGSMVVHFVIIWWIQIETGDPVMLSLGQFFYFLPMLISMPIAGVFSDKLKRKNIILVVDSLQAYATVMLVIFFIFDVANVWLVFTFIGLRSIFQAFHQPTVAAITPSMVPKSKLSRINGINFLFIGLIQLIGPALGALLLQFLTIKEILWVDVITFLIALIPLIFVKIPTVRDESEVKEKTGFIKELKIGFSALRLIPGLIILLVMSMSVNFLVQPLGTLLPYYINITHGGLEGEYALVSILLQIGIMGGAILTSIKKEWKHKIELTLFGIAYIGVGYAILALIPRGMFYFIGIDLMVVGAVLPIINTIYQTIVQTNIAQDKLGRVTSIDNTLSMVISPIGSIIAGPLVAIIGIQSLFLICAIATIAIPLSLYFFTNIRHVRYNGRLVLEEADILE
ncbi:MAG: MFS transporter [Promethearchaeota archaeon]|jgi:DHA3 family macrolide efflux protein-like MFS transporter